MRLCTVCDAPLPENAGGRPAITCSPRCAAKRRAARDALASGWAEASVARLERSAALAEADGATWAPAYRLSAQEARRTARILQEGGPVGGTRAVLGGDRGDGFARFPAPQLGRDDRNHVEARVPDRRSEACARHVD